jgi:hypothetical protein
MYVVFRILIQDGERQRYEFRPREIEDDLTDEQIDVIGNEIITEEYSTDELSDGFFWDDFGQIAGCNDGYDVIPNKKSFDLFSSIIIC